MHVALAGFLLALAALAAPPAQAQAAPPTPPRVEVSIHNSQAILQSLEGETLPFAVSRPTQTLSARAYTEHLMDTDELRLETRDGSSVSARLGQAYADVTVEDLFGNMHAAVGADGPLSESSTSQFYWGGNAVLTLPARSMLTLVGWISVRSQAEWDRNYMWFERGLIAGTEGVFGERYILNASDASSQFFITAVNPLDQEATFYYYTQLGGLAFAIIAVPEPASWALSGAGLLVLLAAARRRARPLPARSGTRARSR